MFGDDTIKDLKNIYFIYYSRENLVFVLMITINHDPW